MGRPYVSRDPFYRAIDGILARARMERLFGQAYPDCPDGGEHEWEDHQPLTPKAGHTYSRCIKCGKMIDDTLMPTGATCPITIPGRTTGGEKETTDG